MNYTGSIIPNQYSWDYQPQTQTETVEVLEYDADGKLVKKTVTTKYRSYPSAYPTQVWCSA